jgi:hypothetical protein
MKKVLLFILFLAVVAKVFAGNVDTTGQKKPETTNQRKPDSPDKNKPDTANAKKNNTPILGDSTNKAEEKCVTCQNNVLTGEDWFLVFLPVVVFLILLIMLFIAGLGKFDLTEAISENEFPKIVEENPVYATALASLKDTPNLAEVLPPTIEISFLSDKVLEQKGKDDTIVKAPPDPHASVSRFIALLTSMLTLVIALCISCFFIYHYVRCGIAPDISGISAVLIALGIGIMPYAFNKVSTAISNNKTE